jgi:hypothetical protein
MNSTDLRPRRWLLVVVAAAAAFVAVRGFMAWSDWSDTDKTSPTLATPSLAARTVDAGAVTVKIRPRQLDDEAATFAVTFDTHSVGLDLDVAHHARLVVGLATWTPATWTGDGPGGHHREGELRFSPDGPAEGTATLTIDGLPKPVAVSWDLGG